MCLDHREYVEVLTAVAGSSCHYAPGWFPIVCVADTQGLLSKLSKWPLMHSAKLRAGQLLQVNAGTLGAMHWPGTGCHPAAASLHNRGCIGLSQQLRAHQHLHGGWPAHTVCQAVRYLTI